MYLFIYACSFRAGTMNESIGILRSSVALKMWLYQKRCFGNQTCMFLRR